MNDFYDKKIQSVPAPKPNVGIDLDDIVIDKISHEEALKNINSLTSVSYDRNRMYEMMEDMCQDTTIASALEAYVEYTACMNDSGKIIWCDAQDSDIAKRVTFILKNLDIDKQIYGWAYSLIKYGDLYVRLYRESDDDHYKKESSGGKQLQESTKVQYYNRNIDKYVSYVKAEKNPAEIFELKRRGKTYTYLKAPMSISGVTSLQSNTNDANGFITRYQYQANTRNKDTLLFQATEYVHASICQSVSRNEESIELFDGDEAETYEVNRGTPLFYNLYPIWKQLKLLENSILLSRLTQSAILRVIHVETGNMSTEDRRSVTHEVSQLIKQKLALNDNTSMNQYLNDSPLINNVIMPTRDGLGKIESTQIGGDVDVKSLADLDYFKNKLFSGLRIPKAYLGDTSDAAGFNGGESLSQISLMFAKTVRRIQNCIIQMCTDLVNLILYDAGQDEFIDQFQLKMCFPDTSESKNRREALAGNIQFIRDFNGLFEGAKLDEETQFSITKALLCMFIDNDDILRTLQEELEKIQEKKNNKTNDQSNNEQKESGEAPLVGSDDASMGEVI